MSLWSFLQHVEVICGSSIILQVVNAHLWIIFALLNDAHFYKNLDLQTIPNTRTILHEYNISN